MSRPIVVIPACTKLIEGDVFDAVGRKYSTAIAEVAECQPLLVPVGAGHYRYRVDPRNRRCDSALGQSLERRPRVLR